MIERRYIGKKVGNYSFWLRIKILTKLMYYQILPLIISSSKVSLKKLVK